MLPDNNQEDVLDLIVVGAGPAGLFCGMNSSGRGERVLIIEKKRSPGNKLLVSGSGRCNLTHDGEIKSFFGHYGDHGRFLRPALLSFSNLDLVSFFEERGLSMTRQEGGKIFPETQRSRDVLDVLVDECRAKKVDIECGKAVTSISKSGDEFVVAAGDETRRSLLLVIATGGRSYPATGSTGDGYDFAKAFGHSIAEVGPALAPVRIRDYPFSKLSGISIPDAEVSIFRGRKVKEHRGDVLFTHEGLSGPGILDISRYIRPEDVLRVSFVRARKEDLERWLLDRSKEDGARNLRSVLPNLGIPARLAARTLAIARIPQDLKCSQLTRGTRICLADCLSGFPMVVEGIGSFDSAMVTKGGVNLEEVNSKTMESKLVPGLYFAGEVLDVDGDTGGYNLQAAFSMGFMAARSIRKRLQRISRNLINDRIYIL